MEKTHLISVLSHSAHGITVEQNKDLFPYLTLRTKTTAEYFIEVQTRDQFIGTISSCIKHHIPFRVIGGGSNIAVVKCMIPGVVIKNRYEKLAVTEDTGKEVVMTVASGFSMARLVAYCLQHGYAGFEYHKGLPGTVGGALYMNSKWTRPWSFVGDNLIEANVIGADGNIKKVDKPYFQFAYDHSILQVTGEYVVEAVFRLVKEDPALLKSRSDEALSYRKKTQPFGVATCGCFFRNISKQDQQRLKLPTTSAGYLIDRCGLKQLQIGAYAVSDVHANFIVNNGKAEGSVSDLLQLVKAIKKKVRETFDVELKEEVVII